MTVLAPLYRGPVVDFFSNSRKWILGVVVIVGMVFLGIGEAKGQIALRGTTENASNTSTLEIDRPAGLLVGDVMIATIGRSDDDEGNLSDQTTATGWTLIDDRIIGSIDDNRWWGSVLYKVATATDVAAASFTFIADPQSERMVGGISAFSGVDVTGGVSGTPFDVSPGTLNVLNGDDLSATSITTVTSNAAIVMAGIIADNRTISGWSTTNPGTLTGIFNHVNAAGARLSVGTAWALKPTTGPTGTGVAELDRTENDRNGSILLALRPITCAKSAGAASSSPTSCINTAITTITHTTTNATGIGAPTNLPAGVTASWASNIITISGTPTASGTFNYSIPLIGCGAAANATGTITVTSPPNSGILSGNQEICVGGASTFSSTVIGGSWSTSNASVATVNASTGVITGVSAGTATITYTVTGTGGCANATSTRTVTVNAPPSAGTLSGVQAICVKGTSLFSSTVTGGTWTSSNPAIATINPSSGLVTGVAVGTATMTYTVASTGGCASATITRTVTIADNEVVFSNAGSFVVPVGVTQLTMKAWGGGGKGGTRDRQAGRSGGGGAGAYSESTNISVTPGETLFYSSGIGSTNTNPGGDSWISRNSDGSNPILLAKGGSSVSDNNLQGALGGKAEDGVGAIRTNGGDGRPGDYEGIQNGGDGGDSPNGGEGGNGGGNGQPGNGNRPGAPGNNPGGGGGGARTNGNNTEPGGNGGNGQISFSYSCPCWRYIDDGSNTGTVIIEFFNDCEWEAPENLSEFEVLVIGGGGGGGSDAGGGGGAGGVVHARADVTALRTTGLPANSVFKIELGDGGEGSEDDEDQGANGEPTYFDREGIYTVTAGGGGGGGSSDNQNGRNGNNSSIRNSTNGLTVVSNRIFGGSGGGAGEEGGDQRRGQGGENGKRGGRGHETSGGGGGGALGEGGDGREEDGGNGGNGIIIAYFDPLERRVFAAGGGGGGEDDRGIGGNGANLRGGNGGREDERGEDGQTPGSGGGGSGEDEDEGGRGAKGIVIVRYEIAKILPVEFMSFTAAYDLEGRNGLLTWSTAKEWESSHFEVERSVNQVKNWEKIGEVNGAGYSDKKTDYAFIDKNLPPSGGNVFYRVRQVDYSGSHSYSVTKAIQVEALKGSSSWIIYPNPTTGTNFRLALIEREKLLEGKVEARVSTTSGQMALFTDSNIDVLSEKIGEYLRHKSSGVYILQLTWNNRSESYKVIKN